MTVIDQLHDSVKEALTSLLRENEITLAETSVEKAVSLIEIEVARRPQYGDFSSALAVRLSQGRPDLSIDLAQKISTRLMSLSIGKLARVAVTAPGFINFSLTDRFLALILQDLHIRHANNQHSINDFRAYDGTGDLSEKVVSCYELCGSILKCATAPSFDLCKEIELAPVLSLDEWRNCIVEYRNDAAMFMAGVDATQTSTDGFARQKSLILHLELAHKHSDGHDFDAVSDAFGKFYQSCRIFTDSINVTKARLGLVLATQIVLESSFDSESFKARELL